FGAAASLAVGLELAGRLRAGFAQELLEPAQHGRPGLLDRAVLRLDEAHELAADLAGVEVGGGVGDALAHHGRQQEPSSRIDRAGAMPLLGRLIARLRKMGLPSSAGPRMGPGTLETQPFTS